MEPVEYSKRACLIRGRCPQFHSELGGAWALVASIRNDGDVGGWTSCVLTTRDWCSGTGPMVSVSAEYCSVIARTSVHMLTLDRASRSIATSSHQHARQMVKGKQGLIERLIVCTRLLHTAAPRPIPLIISSVTDGVQVHVTAQQATVLLQY